MSAYTTPGLRHGRIFLHRLGRQRRHPAVRGVHNQRGSSGADDLLVPVVPEFVVVAHDVGGRVLVVISSRRFALGEFLGLVVGKHLLATELAWSLEWCGGREVPDALEIRLTFRGPGDLVPFCSLGRGGRLGCRSARGGLAAGRQSHQQ